MTRTKSTYTLAEAAEFLNITEKRLVELTSAGQIRIQSYQRRSFYLGGELDAARLALQERVNLFTGE